MSDIILRSASDGTAARVRSPEGQLETFSITVDEFENVSATRQLAFSWSIVPVILANADTMLLVQNDHSTLDLHIEDVWVTLDTSSLVQIHLTDRATLTPGAGTLVIGTCWNSTAPRVAEAIAYADEQNNVQGNILWNHEILADVRERVPMHGAAILSKGQSLAVDVTTAQTIGCCTVNGFFAKPDSERS